MKRASQGGSSPHPKQSPFYVEDSGAEDFDFLQNSETLSSDQESLRFSFSSPTTSSQSQSTVFPRLSQAIDQQTDDEPLLPLTQFSSEEQSNSDIHDVSFSSSSSQHNDWTPSSTSEDELPDIPDFGNQAAAKILVDELVDEVGISNAASAVLENEALREEIMKKIFSSSHKSLKIALKKSQLTSNKKNRAYLLSLSPRNICEEFKTLSSASFRLLVHGLLGISDLNQIFESQFLLNNVCLLYSTIGKIINRNATGYALLLTTVARDGGLREDSLRIFSFLVHPRTSQKYDRSVLASDWDAKLNEHLKQEKIHFEAMKEVETKIETLLQNDAAEDVINDAKNDLEALRDTCPPQLQMVWDNLNLRTSHRYQRVGDEYGDSNLDWMASLWIKDRITANHMEHQGESLKSAENLNIRDFVPNDKEKDYVFLSLVRYFSHRLVQRHPLLFKSIALCIKPNKPHQFQDAMDSKSEEFTGNLFTLSESRIEDLITMMSEVQLNVHTYTDSSGAEHCHERKIVAGDNKTEKNMTYGILRFVA